MSAKKMTTRKQGHKCVINVVDVPPFYSSFEDLAEAEAWRVGLARTESDAIRDIERAMILEALGNGKP